MRGRFRAAAGGLLLVLLAGATASARAAAEIDSPVQLEVGGVLSEDQVGRAVRAALARRGWSPRNGKAGYVEATLEKPDVYWVSIALRYDTKKVTVRYLDSEGLDYDARDGTIHSSYNKWMRMLSKDINVNLAMLASTEHGDPFEPAIVPEVVPVVPAPSAASPPPAEAAAPPPPSAPGAGSTLRAGAELHAQARLASPVMATSAAAATVSPKGPVRNAEGTWWYVKIAAGAGWVRQSDLE